jgi:hypothetical protein
MTKNPKNQVSKMGNLLTEIRTFYSLKEIQENVETEIEQHKMLLEDYSQWLGTLLRNPESSKDQDWGKKTAELQKVLKSGNRKGNKKEEKRTDTSTEWIAFKDIMLNADNLGEAEMLFEAIEELKTKIDRLEKARSSIADLERYGLGKDLLYITYIKDGVPERLVFKPKKGTNAVEKFEFSADFSILEQI